MPDAPREMIDAVETLALLTGEQTIADLRYALFADSTTSDDERHIMTWLAGATAWSSEEAGQAHVVPRIGPSQGSGAPRT